jgi:5-methylcytosine-specific restriction enzyme subunit McrC
MDKIPIRNLYYLISYAWDQLEEADVVDIVASDPHEIADLFGHVLIGGTRHLLRRGLEQGYQQIEEELQGVRGKIDLLKSARRMLLVHGRTSCSYDELTTNTTANRILKATIRGLARTADLDSGLKHGLNCLFRSLGGIDDVPLNLALFRGIQLHGNNRYYRFLLSICELVCRSLLIDEASGDQRFRDFRRDERAMASLFQNFVLNFLRRLRPDLRPRAEKIRWSAISESDPALTLIPGMTTDISLSTLRGEMIIDTKYYKNSLSEHWGKKSIHADNLYQLFAYLVNASLVKKQQLSGMLLYPRVDRTLRESYRIHGFEVRLCTVNLAADWKEIRDELLGLVDEQVKAAVA